MAAKKTQTKRNTSNGSAALPAGFFQEETAGQLDGEWVQPVVGTVVSGKLVRAFQVKQADGEVTNAYGIRDDDNAVWLVGERAAFAAAIQATRLGTDVFLRFDGKEALEDKAGRKTGRTIWRVTFATKRNGKGQLASEALEGVAKPAAPQGGADSDVPF
jgi:hypothetical protein